MTVVQVSVRELQRLKVMVEVGDGCLVLAAARIRVNPATGPLPFPNACEIVLVIRRSSSQLPTPMAECGWVTDPNQRWPSAPAFGG